MTSKIFIIGLLLLVGVTARAEDRPVAPDPIGWISNLGPTTFNDAGGMFLPLSVLDGMRQGAIAPIQQFALSQHAINNCTKKALEETPDVRAPFVVATATFKWGVCLMSSCLKNILLLQLIPLMSNKYSSDNGAGAKMQGQALVSAFQQQEGCDGTGNSGLDPQMAQIFQ